MAIALLILLEKELPQAQAAYKKSGTGKALVREEDRLNFAARRCSVTALSAMLSENQSALIAQLVADGFDPAKMRLPPEQWFPATDGLTAIRGLVNFVGTNLNDFKQPNPIIRDLKAAETLLIAADTAGVRFHFVRAEL